MRVLIISQQHDIHAHALIWALAQRGVKSDLLSISDLPENQRISTTISNLEDLRVSINGLEDSALYSAVWMRRFENPASFSPNLARSDIEMAQCEARRYAEGAINLIMPHATWINPIESARMANIKPYQLTKAKRVGFSIPETLISNDPTRIASFWKEHKGQIIYKSFAPAFWRNAIGDKVSALFTSTFPENMFDERESFTSCPGIYQALIQKRADLRVVFFGNTFCGARIYSQTIEKSVLDFRSDMKGEALLEPYEIPLNIQKICADFRDELGLLHGSFDFAEALDGTPVFLEVNQMGQFLWLEERLPSLHILDMFTSFSLTPDRSFTYKRNDSPLTFEQFVHTDTYKDARKIFDDHFLSTQSARPFTYIE